MYIHIIKLLLHSLNACVILKLGETETTLHGNIARNTIKYHKNSHRCCDIHKCVDHIPFFVFFVRRPSTHTHTHKHIQPLHQLVTQPPSLPSSSFLFISECWSTTAQHQLKFQFFMSPTIETKSLHHCAPSLCNVVCSFLLVAFITLKLTIFMR